MTIAPELELKLDVPGKRVTALQTELERRGARTLSLESRYFDTPDRALARAGLSLRLRSTDGAWEQTLKARGVNAVTRDEDTVARPGAWGAEGPPLDLSMFSKGHARKLLLGELKDAGGQALTLSHRSVVTRLSADVEVGDTLVEIAFDRGEVRNDAQAAPISEIEYELKRGDPKAVVGLARAALLEHGLALSSLSKAARGARLVDFGARASKARRPTIDDRDSGTTMARAVLASCLEQVLGNATELAEGRVDDEVVHQLRVGLRRLRTAWREFAPLMPACSDAWLQPVTEVFRELGMLRDRQAVAEHLQRSLAAAGSPAPDLAAAMNAPAPDAVQIVRAPAFQGALLEVIGCVLGSAGDRPAELSARSHIEARLQRLHRALERGARDFDRLEPAERHRVRKRLKRLRYLSEMVSGLYRSSRVARYLARLVPAQEALGTYNDLIVGVGLARGSAEQGRAESWFNVGWLQAQLPHGVHEASRALARAAEAKRFWV